MSLALERIAVKMSREEREGPLSVGPRGELTCGFRPQAEDQRLSPAFHLKVEATGVDVGRGLQPHFRPVPSGEL